jgi:hypothetical protein
MPYAYVETIVSTYSFPTVRLLIGTVIFW